ncbi:MAG: glycine--tRNA ligase subunit beta [Kangiellaceae bacterium]
MTNSSNKNTITNHDFLFELGCEELPPKALPKLAHSLHSFLSSSFKDLALNFEDSEWFATPRRLAVRFINLDSEQATKEVEKLGPAVAAAFDQNGIAKPAAIGFAKSNGVDVSELNRKQTNKGERLAFVAEIKGIKTSELLKELLPKAVSQLPAPKSMRWGNEPYLFSRPVHWVLALLDDKVVELDIFGLKANNISYGHRFHSAEPVIIKSPREYEQTLSQQKVVACFEERKAKIRIQVEKIAEEMSAKAVVTEELLEEVTALVEWPVALLGNFDQEFLQVPAEALVSSMAEHQKYFHLVSDENNPTSLLPHFITVSNIESTNPDLVVSGNEKVIRPRLADAKFFYDTDCQQSLESFSERLKKIVFQQKLGSLFDKTQRVKSLACNIATSLNFDPKLAARAADLCKCDLMTDMVGEFSDLQGVMGRYYATKDGEDQEVATALEEVYKPRFAGDTLPKTNTGLILALAERIDTLVGIFGIGQVPTGAKDPFALRRASLGVLRLISERNLGLDLSSLIDEALKNFNNTELEENTKQNLLEYFSARSHAMYQELGFSSRVISSVSVLNITKPTDFFQRVKAVKIFDESDESSDLAEANKRVKNILAKSNFKSDQNNIDQSLFEDSESVLYNKIIVAQSFVNAELEKLNYQGALEKLAELKEPVNQFFDSVMVNNDDENLRNNRFALISELRNLFIGIADISLLQK